MPPRQPSGSRPSSSARADEAGEGRDGEEALAFVAREATTYDLQARCVAALIRKTEILWHLLDCVHAAYVEPGWGPGGARG